jgi:hypothetical protein
MDRFRKVNDVVDIVTENDSYFVHSTEVKRDVYHISCYKEMLPEKKLQAMELTFYTLFKKNADNSSGNKP